MINLTTNISQCGIVMEKKLKQLLHKESVIVGKLFEELKKGLEDIIAHQEGKLTLKSEFIEIPEPPVSGLSLVIIETKPSLNLF